MFLPAWLTEKKFHWWKCCIRIHSSMQRKHLWESGCTKSCWALKHLSLSVYGNTHAGFDRTCWNNVSREFQLCIYDDALLKGKTKTFNSSWCVCTFINISKCFFCTIYQPERLLACMLNSILQTCADCSHLAVQTFGCKAQTREGKLLTCKSRCFCEMILCGEKHGNSDQTLPIRVDLVLESRW